MHSCMNLLIKIVLSAFQCSRCLLSKQRNRELDVQGIETRHTREWGTEQVQENGEKEGKKEKKKVRERSLRVTTQGWGRRTQRDKPGSKNLLHLLGGEGKGEVRFLEPLARSGCWGHKGAVIPKPMPTWPQKWPLFQCAKRTGQKPKKGLRKRQGGQEDPGTIKIHT